MAFERTDPSSSEVRRAGSVQDYERQHPAAGAPNADLQAEDAWLDNALKETFPASDPIPIRHHDAPPPRENG